jgi:transcriptional regulator with XRE-family HTH domain
MSTSELNPAESPLALFGVELRRYRLKAGLTQEQLADQIQFSESLVGAVERAKRVPSRSFTELCEKALSLNGDLLRLWPLVTNEASPKWFRPWPKIEAEAHTLRTWQPLVVPGLLQTPAYARMVLSGVPGVSEAQIDESVEARLQRQTIFTRPNAPMYSALIDSGVLDRPLGGVEVMREQLEHLAAMMAHRRITLQIVQSSVVPTVGLLGGFVIAQLDNRPETVYLDTAADGEVTDRTDTVRTVTVRYDAIRAWADPIHVSEEVIRRKLVDYGHQ